MSFFAVASLDNEAFDIAGCHLNLWCIPYWLKSRYFHRALLSKHRMFCDVGLRIKAESNVSGIEILLPFESEPNKFCDLSELVLDKDISPLIFGREVDLLPGQKIRYDGSSVHEAAIEEEVLTIPKEKAKLISDDSGRSFSAWHITFRRALTPNERVYLRVRFGVKDPGQVWTSRGWGLAKRGVIVDLRLCDVREAAEVPEWGKYRPRIKPIQKLNLFLIVPIEKIARIFSPAVHYLRLLEHTVWDKYIRFGNDITPPGKLSIYQWRAPIAGSSSSAIGREQGGISVEKPFRIFVDLHQDFGMQIFLAYIAALLLPTLISFMVKFF